MVVVCSLFVGVVMPAPAGAQDVALPAGYEEPPPPEPSAAERSATEVEPLESEAPSAEPWRLELMAGVAPSFGLGLNNTLGGLESTPIFADVGIPIGSRALLMVGATVHYTSFASGGESFGAAFPLQVHAYLDRPRAGAFIPSVRIGAFGGLWGSSEFEPSIQWGAVARAGLTWLPVEQIGIRVELGPRLFVSHWGDSVSAYMLLDAAASVVVRL